MSSDGNDPLEKDKLRMQKRKGTSVGRKCTLHLNRQNDELWKTSREVDRWRRGKGTSLPRNQEGPTVHEYRCRKVCLWWEGEVVVSCYLFVCEVKHETRSAERRRV